LPSGKPQQSAFLKIKGEMQNQALLQAVQAVSQVFDLESWLTSKIEGRRFALVVKAKFEQEQRVRLDAH